MPLSDKRVTDDNPYATPRVDDKSPVQSTRRRWSPLAIFLLVLVSLNFAALTVVLVTAWMWLSQFAPHIYH